MPAINDKIFIRSKNLKGIAIDEPNGTMEIFWNNDLNNDASKTSTIKLKIEVLNSNIKK